MNKVANRSFIVLAFILLLFGGTIFFVVEYSLNAEKWALNRRSPYVNTTKVTVQMNEISDADGEVIVELGNDRVYHSDLMMKKSFLHWVGDRKGNIATKIIEEYEAMLEPKEVPDVSYDFINGIYQYGKNSKNAPEDNRKTEVGMKLTLDGDLQTIALNALGDRRGTVALVNYKTGQILCAVSTPTFDPDNAPYIDPEDPGEYRGAYINNFIREKYIPGSIFKTVTLAVALECIPGVQEQTFTCTGIVQYGVDSVTCERAHGTQTLKEAFCNSCNCAFGELTVQIGKERMAEYVSKFGVVESVNFDGLSTRAGNYNVSNAVAQELAWSGIGQYTDEINPCTFVRFVGAIANGGISVQPYVVDSVRVDGSVTYRAETKENAPILSAQTAAILREYMGNNVTQKYGANNFPGISVCAKSGTGEVGGNKRPNAMFTGFVSDPDIPVAFIVCVEDAGYGAPVCVPILTQVLQACKNELN